MIGWPLSFVALFFIFKTILSNSPDILIHVKTPTPILFAGGVICFFTYFALRAIVWRLLLKESGHDITLKESTYLWSFAELKRYVPGNIWSFLTKTLSFESKGVSRRTIAKLLFIEIGMFLISCLIFSLLSINFLFNSVLPMNLNFLNQLIIPFTGILLVFYIFNKTLIPKTDNKILAFFRFFLPDFRPSVIVNLLLINLLFLFFYGLGYFLIISSVVYLPLNQSLSLVGFFVFSLLAGYLSFITPMGLGVREGMITIGLAKYLTIGLAGFSSIFARICLIITEVIFIALIYVWRNAKSRLLSNEEKFISKNLHLILLTILVLLYIYYFSTVSFLRYDNFFTGKFDLGNMEHTIWNTVNGNFFMLTDPNGTKIMSRLAFHADFILLLFAPIYYIWGSAKLLLITQTVVLSLGAFFVYLISRNVLKNTLAALLLSVSFLLNPSVQLTNLYDFHAITLATTLFLGAFYFLTNKKYYIFLIFLFLASITKEQAWLVSAIFGIYIFIAHKKRLLGTALTITSFIVFYLLVSYIMPALHGGEHFALSYYSDFGNTPLEIVRNIFINPILVVSKFMSESSLEFLFKIFLPVGFISIINPLTLIFAIPDLTINILSSNAHLRQIYYQYTAVITPFIFISSIYAINLLSKKIKILSINYLAWYVFFFTIFSAYLYGPLPLSKHPNISVFTQKLSYAPDIDSILRSVPQEASIAATNNLGSHLVKRERIYTFPVGIYEADYVAFLVRDRSTDKNPSRERSLMNSFRTNYDYMLLYKKKDFLLFKKIPNSLL